MRTPQARANGPDIGVWMILQDRKVLARLMVVQGLSQRQLAARAGFAGHSYVGELVRGEANTLTPKRAQAVAEVLGVTVNDLFLPEVTIKSGRRQRNRTRAA